MIFINSILASLLRTGSVSWLFYADRFAQLPIGVFTVALASVLLPTLSKAAAEKKPEEFEAALSNALRYTSFCIIPVSVAAYALARPLTALLYERGQFTAQDTVMTALATQAMCFGLWGVSMLSMTVRGFIAQKDTATPAAIGVLSLLFNVVISVLVMGAPEAEGSAAAFVASMQSALGGGVDWGHTGLALAIGLSSTVSFAVSLVVLDGRYPFSWRPFLLAAYKTLAASLGMLAVMRMVEGRLGAGPVAAVMIEGALGGAAFLAFAAMLSSLELRETFALAGRLLRKIREKRRE